MGDTAAEQMSKPAKRSKIDNGSQVRGEGVPGNIDAAAKDELVAEQGNEEEADDEADIEDRKILEEQSAAMQELETFQAKIRDVRTLRHSHVSILPEHTRASAFLPSFIPSGSALRWRRADFRGP